MQSTAAQPRTEQFLNLAKSDRLHSNATVQDFLEMYEVGETVGVGGTRF